MLARLKKLLLGSPAPASAPAQAPTAPKPAAPPLDLSRAGQLLDDAGIDWRGDEQRRFVREVVAPRVGHALSPLLLDPAWRGNPWCSPLDAAVLFAVVTEFEPTRMMEVGAGYTTLVFNHARRVKNLPGELITVDPAPRTDIEEHVDALLLKPVQEVPVEDFQILQKGELLFLDTTRVDAPGTDVEYLISKVLPALNAGVFVGLHGVRFPREYSAEELKAGASEHHRLAEFLRRSGRAEVFFSGGWLGEHDPTLLPSVLPATFHGSAPSTALWFRIR